jgi:GAF domain-containing protein
MEGNALEPLPETEQALRYLAEADDSDLAAALARAGELAVSVVPDCVGLSLSVLDQGVTLTLVATCEMVASMDAMQYLDGGPCVDAALLEETVDVAAIDALDERRWQLFARAGAAQGVASSLSLPIQEDGRVVGSVNLYASSANAFEGHDQELAGLFGAWAPGAVRNADLSFSTRLDAAAAPARLQDQYLVDQATGMLAASQRLHILDARNRLRDAAANAGLTETQVARAILEAHAFGK